MRCQNTRLVIPAPSTFFTSLKTRRPWTPELRQTQVTLRLQTLDCSADDHAP